MNNYSKPSTTEERYFLASPSHARWIFGLLSIVETHLTGDEIHILRELTRSILALIKERLKQALRDKTRTPAELTSEQESITPWWVNVAIVVTIWGQRDLWSDAQDMVRQLQV